MSRQTALIIEDQRSIGSLLTKVFKLRGISSEIVSQLNPTLTQLEEITPSIILLDMKLSTMNAHKILEFICSQAHLTQSTLIVLASEPIQDKICAERVNYALTTPLDIQYFVQLIRQITLKNENFLSV